jgi:hypothetical protein
MNEFHGSLLKCQIIFCWLPLYSRTLPKERHRSENANIFLHILLI